MKSEIITRMYRKSIPKGFPEVDSFLKVPTEKRAIEGCLQFMTHGKFVRAHFFDQRKLILAALGWFKKYRPTPSS